MKLWLILSYGPQVTNVVVTSSFASVLDTTPNLVHKSDTWNPITWDQVDNELVAYIASKKYAEKAARDFIMENNVNFKLATVNPPYVLGPQLFDFAVKENLNASNAWLLQNLKIDKTLTTPLDQELFLAIHVDDVAEFHVLPLENKKLEDARMFIVGGPIVAQSILNVVNKEFPEVQGKVAKGKPDSADELLKLAPKYDISDIVEKADGYKFIPIEQCITDVLGQYFEHFPLK
ncbi:unnamed protein product [Ambrosiozyma monospora]|uniref:Unnamed protein product n=1 Tax=Ambrosiozyma monospora TaxID=43982 RepID=A0A9W6YV99_AMBMO|nr:unnamed protein product [Ambrosiozyma monospora]